MHSIVLTAGKRRHRAILYAKIWKLWNGRLAQSLQTSGTIGNIPPAEAQEQYYAMLDAQSKQHNLNETVYGKPGTFQSLKALHAKI